MGGRPKYSQLFEKYSGQKSTDGAETCRTKDICVPGIISFPHCLALTSNLSKVDSNMETATHKKKLPNQPSATPRQQTKESASHHVY